MNKIDLLLKSFKEIEILQAVYQEAILEGLESKFEDSLILKNYLDKGKIKIIRLENKYSELSNKIQNLNNLGIGESQAIALAKQLNRKELIIDEALARETAKSFDLIPIGSLKVLLLAYEENILNEKEIEETINKMIKIKFRISAATLIRFWELFEKLKK
ncbi:DUF3368 domain-containing protein [Candidatus Woesearchaeota archaeon]|nr:DUF3368 domain-containing protein [Candidatus Woesearchaeota archaeon]